MLSSLAGVTVARAIPDSLLAGLAMGTYALHGGVIRHAAGTAQAGQIVAHLLPTTGSAAGGVLSGAGIVAGAAASLTPVGVVGLALSGIGAVAGVVGAGFGIATFIKSRKILAAVKEGLALAELNLSVMQAGFAALDQRLHALEQTLQQVYFETNTIRNLLQSSVRAELLASLEHLERLPMVNDERVRIELLTHSATTLSKLGHLYLDQLRSADSIPASMAIEEHFLIAVLSQARCYAELREPAMARSILADAADNWHRWARSFARDVLIDKHPQRFLHGDFAPIAPLPLLTAWLDFAHNEQKGITWIDELRSSLDPWYYHRSLDAEPRESRRSDTSTTHTRKGAIEREYVVPALNKLLARSGILASYVGQFSLMEQHRLTPGELEQYLQLLTPIETEADVDDGFLVLEIQPATVGG